MASSNVNTSAVPMTKDGLILVAGPNPRLMWGDSCTSYTHHMYHTSDSDDEKVSDIMNAVAETVMAKLEQQGTKPPPYTVLFQAAAAAPPAAWTSVADYSYTGALRCHPDYLEGVRKIAELKQIRELIELVDKVKDAMAGRPVVLQAPPADCLIFVRYPNREELEVATALMRLQIGDKDNCMKCMMERAKSRVQARTRCFSDMESTQRETTSRSISQKRAREEGDDSISPFVYTQLEALPGRKKRPVRCEFFLEDEGRTCGTVLGDKSAYNRHLAMHKKYYKAWCYVCGQRFKQPFNMTPHLLKHKLEDLPSALLHGINVIDKDIAAGIESVAHMVKDGKLVLPPLREGERPYIYAPYNMEEYGVPKDYNDIKTKVTIMPLPEQHIERQRKRC